jgi:hypothetical protein
MLVKEVVTSQESHDLHHFGMLPVADKESYKAVLGDHIIIICLELEK